MTTRSGSSGTSRRGPDALLLHLLQASGALSALTDPITQTQRMASMLRGIQKYQLSDHPAQRRPHTIVWKRGAAALMHMTAAPHKKGTKSQSTKPAILLIPSLINGWEILDILPEKISFARALMAAGHDVYIIDWGDLREDPEITSMDDLLLLRLKPMVELLAGLVGGRITLAGYCMGGLLMAGTYPHVESSVDRLVFLATPWDFHAGDPHLTSLVRSWAPGVLPMLPITDFLPNGQIQSLFALVDPDMAMTKYSRFADMSVDDPRATMFVAVEDWLQSGRDLPAEIARMCLQQWYLENRTGQETWEIGGVRITPDLFRTARTLFVTPESDQLVELQTARALPDAIGKSAHVLIPPTGHIGMMTSQKMTETLWPQIAGWLATR